MGIVARLIPSPAMSVALIALFVALGGIGYSAATGAIDSREIKNNTIRGRDVRANTLTGADVRNGRLTGQDVADNALRGSDVLESSLGAVPNATQAATAATALRAQSADSADSAKSVNGIGIVAIKHRSADVTNQTVLDAGGLQLIVSCGGGNEDVRARTTIAGGEIAAISDDAAATDLDADPDASQSVVHNLDDDFGPGEEFDIADTVVAADDRIYELHYLGGDGRSVTTHLITDDALGTSNCIVSGYAIVS